MPRRESDDSQESLQCSLSEITAFGDPLLCEEAELEAFEDEEVSPAKKAKTDTADDFPGFKVPCQLSGSPTLPAGWRTLSGRTPETPVGRRLSATLPQQ